MAPSPHSESTRADGGSRLSWLAFGVVAVLGVCSLPLPFGRDQGLYYYVAREWALRGSIPYRDVFDHKPPGIYVIHRLAIALFGEVQWGIRVLDFACVLLLGLVVARLATPVRSKVARDARAIATLWVAVLFYGVLNYWDGAQSEIYYTLFGVAAIACALHVLDLRKAALAVGVLAGAAMIVKPPVVWFLFAAVAALALRMRRERAPVPRWLAVAGLCALGAALPIGVMLAYFAAHGALAAMLDVVVGANGYYVAHEHARDPIADALDGSQGYLAFYAPFSSLLFLGGALVPWLSVRTGYDAWAKRYVWAWILVLCAYAATAMQMKFYLLHWTPMVVAMALLGTLLWMQLRAQLARAKVSARVLAVLPIALILALWLGSRHGRSFVEQQIATTRYLRGVDSRERFASRFAFPEVHFSYAEAEWVGLWLRAHTTPEDFVAVRGFEPEVYAVAHRRHSGRFFWTTFLTVPARAYRRAEYLAEDLRAFEGERRPKYVVARRDPSTHDGADSVSYFEPLGYQPEVEHGAFVILRDVR